MINAGAKSISSPSGQLRLRVKTQREALKRKMCPFVVVVFLQRCSSALRHSRIAHFCFKWRDERVDKGH